MTEQHVAGQGLHACTVGVNMKILIWIMWPRILISGGGFSPEESEGNQKCMGCMVVEGQEDDGAFYEKLRRLIDEDGGNG